MKLLRSDIYENLMMALATLRSNKLRSFLTVVGVVIGVWTVMAIASIISGIDTAVKKEVESFGTRSIFIAKFQPGIRIGRLSREERMRKELTYDDAMAIAKLPAVETAVPFLDVTNNFFGQKILVTANGKTSAAVSLQGTLPEFEKAGTEVITEGRFFSQFENDQNERVCVIGASVVENFFPYASPMDKTIEIAGQEFRVVGMLEKRETFLSGDDQNNVIYLPFGVVRKLKPNADDVYIMAVARPGMMDEAKDQVTDLLRVRRQVPFGRPDNFGMATSESIIEQFRSITRRRRHRDGRDLFCGLDGRRHRRDEHHARLRDRAHARDRCAQSHRGARARHPLAIPDRSDDADRDGRADRADPWLVDDAPDTHARAVLRSTVGSHRRLRRQRRHRPHLRSLARMESRAPRPD